MRNRAESSWRRWLRSVALPAWAISALCHLLIFMTVATLVGSGVLRDAEANLEVEREVVIQLDSPAFEVEAKPAAEQALPAAAQATGLPQPPVADRSRSELLDQAFEQPRPRAVEGGPRTELAEGLNADLMLGSKLPEVRLPSPAPPKIETQFFGSKGQGTKFVYVIDRSASMQFGLEPAKKELLASLDRLPPTAEFQVVLYDLEARPLEFNNQSGLMQASKENKVRTARHLETIRSEGGTDHLKALKRGLALSPHVLYFLTDADELKPGQVQELTALNQRGSKAIIHCIELSLDNASRQDNPLRRLARDNQGEYRGIDLLKPRP